MKARARSSLSIGQAIRAVRRARDLTQEELAASAGVVPTYITAIERNRGYSVRLTTFGRVVRSLGCRLVVVPDDDDVVSIRLPKKTIARLDALARDGLHGVDRDRVAEGLIYDALKAEKP